MPKAGKPGFYAIAKGRRTGVFESWDDCQSNIQGFPGAKYKKFVTLAEAQDWIRGTGNDAASTSGPAVSIQIGGQAISTKVKGPVASHSSSKGKEKETTRTSDLEKQKVADSSKWQIVYSDGACKGNGKEVSVAGVGVFWGPQDPRNIAERCPGAQTNNRAELIAIVRVLESTPMSKTPLLIRTDSQYSMNCFLKWLPNWKKNGFKSANGAPVKNAALIRYLDVLLSERARNGQKVHLEYVRGHSGEPGNEGADYLANMGCLQGEAAERDWKKLTSSVRVRIEEERKPQVNIQSHSAAGATTEKTRPTSECISPISIPVSPAIQPTIRPSHKHTGVQTLPWDPDDNEIQGISAVSATRDLDGSNATKSTIPDEELQAFADCLLPEEDLTLDLDD